MSAQLAYSDFPAGWLLTTCTVALLYNTKLVADTYSTMSNAFCPAHTST